MIGIMVQGAGFEPAYAITGRCTVCCLDPLGHPSGWVELETPEGKDGGAKRDRTADLYNAIVALSQLSYGPETLVPRWGAGDARRGMRRAGRAQADSACARVRLRSPRRLSSPRSRPRAWRR